MAHFLNIVAYIPNRDVQLGSYTLYIMQTFSPRDMIESLQAMVQQGMLHADLVAM